MSCSSLKRGKRGMFQYVLIPADKHLAIEQLESSKEGGLSDDYLSKEAKKYFFEKSGGAERASMLDNATPAEKKALAQKIRNDYANSSQKSVVDQLDDDALLNILRTSQASATCEIIALTIPTKINNFTAVSLYGGDDARLRGMPLNERATDLMRACGHSLPSITSEHNDGKPPGIYGDAFVGRCIDDEIKDIWERVDFPLEDARPDAEWCRLALKKGGGGGSGGKSPASLSGMMNQANLLHNTNNHSSNVHNDQEKDGFTWSQSDDEVELKFSVAPGTKAKYVKIKFQWKSLKVVVAGQVLLEGETWGNIVVDECTYTLQDDGSKGRELCVTLSKKVEEHWNYAVMKKH